MTPAQYDQIELLKENNTSTAISVYEVTCRTCTDEPKIQTSFEHEAIGFIVDHQDHRTWLHEFFL